MYATAEQIFGEEPNHYTSHLASEPYLYHNSHRRENYTPLMSRVSPGTKQAVTQEKTHNNSHLHEHNVGVNLNWKTEFIKNTADPKVWGPAFWFSLHIAAAHYPMKASPLVKERMKARIMAIPYEIPCHSCQGHASAFIENHRDQLDKIVSGRHELGKFYVDFHNKVNARHNKKLWSYEEAYKMYSGGAKITYLQ